MKKRLTVLLVTVALLLLTTATGFCTYTDDGLTRAQVVRYLASILFDVSLASLDDPVQGVNYPYNNNDWGGNPSLLPDCQGYDGGHSGIDMQTKDVAGEKTGERPFYALSAGEVIAVGDGPYNILAVYDQGQDRTALYFHASKIIVNKEESVKVGDELGMQGAFGVPAGWDEHVHFELRSGRTSEPACGAGESFDPAVLYDDIVELLERRMAAGILPPLMASSNTYLLCNNRIHIEFETNTYSPKNDLSFYIEVCNTAFEKVASYYTTKENVYWDRYGTFALHSGGAQQNVIRVKFDTPVLSDDELDALKPRMYYRVYVKNMNLQQPVPTIRGFNWDTYFTLFVPKLVTNNLNLVNTLYAGENQNAAQRYIRVDTSQCY
ncbi:M23 family metallopeptidase [Desulfococcaceae bacterium HSG7]|nr:M23 family metallopeptidase [Desulfococcaceae bacterium HSG7]